MIQWDEWPSAKRSSWEAVLRFLESLRTAHPDTYRAKVFICYGDFRQIPPVLPRASRTEIVNNTVRKSTSWSAFELVKLQRIHRQNDDKDYACFLDTVGSGTASADRVLNGEGGYISLQRRMAIDDEREAIRFASPSLNDPTDCARARISAATNSLVDAYNERVLHTLVQTYRLPSFTKLSADYFGH